MITDDQVRIFATIIKKFSYLDDYGKFSYSGDLGKYAYCGHGHRKSLVLREDNTLIVENCHLEPTVTLIRLADPDLFEKLRKGLACIPGPYLRNR